MVRVGQKLREKRRERGLTLSEVAKATKIKESFLDAIEKGEYNKLPSSAYAFGFVSNYVEFLGLPKKETLAMFRREFDEKKYVNVLPEGLSRKKNVPFGGFRVHQTVFLVIILFFMLIGYLLFQYRYAIIPPPLTLTQPEDGVVTSQDVTVSGHTDPSAIVYVNNQPTPVSEDGEFMTQISLFSGNNAITVVAKHRLGKETVVKRTVMVR